MLLRISLIIAILAGVGALVVTQVKVRPHIQSIIEQRNDFERQKNQQMARANKAEKELKDTQGKLVVTQNNLANTQKQLNVANKDIADLKERNTTLSTTLNATQEKLTRAQQDISAYEATGLKPEQVQALKTDYKNAQTEIAGKNEENRMLANEVLRLKDRIGLLVGKENYVVKLPSGLNGKVVAVDPKWDFVVLNIGEKQGVRPNGVMMVHRNSRLVGKVKIMSVMPDRSIANIMPGWSQNEIQEGDEVLF